MSNSLPTKLLENVLYLFTERKGLISSKVNKHLQFRQKKTIFLVRFTKNNTPFTYRNENISRTISLLAVQRNLK